LNQAAQCNAKQIKKKILLKIFLYAVDTQVEVREVIIMNLSEIVPVGGEQSKRINTNLQTETAREKKAEAPPIQEGQSDERSSDTFSLRKPAQVASFLLTERLSSQLNISRGGRLTNNSDPTQDSESKKVLESQPNSRQVGELDKERFDIQEVASNVLNFIGSALDELTKSGASDEQISEKINAAKKGIENGFESALHDLGNLVSEQLKDDIAKTKSVIEEGLGNYSNQLLATFRDVDIIEQAKQADSQSSQFSIKTRDGDEVTISFSNKEVIGSSTKYSDSHGTESVTYYAKTQNFDLSIIGKIDEDESQAITDLVNKVDEITSQFFYGDVTKAYEQALELGFDNEQLSGFALTLRQSESSSKLRQYGEVEFNGQSDGVSNGGTSPKSVAQYMNKMLDVMDKSKELLDSEDEYKSIINGLINEMKDVQVPDLVSAINKFYKFTSNLNLISNQSR
jgi:hypothetical protein